MADTEKDKSFLADITLDNTVLFPTPDAPEIDNTVWVTAPHSLEEGLFYDIIYTDADEFELHGEVQ